MKRVFVCSPYRGDVERNVAVARAACRDVIRAGDAPFAPHLLYPDFLDDDIASDRDLGIGAGLEWLSVSDEILVVGAPTDGMRVEIDAAELFGVPIRRVAVSEIPPVARRPSFVDSLRCRLLALWTDWGALLAIALVVLGFFLCPGP